MPASPRGFLSDGTAADVVMMACTAGHVDHGKTSLVKLLTGCMTDRLKEEIERGMSIELGFAPCFLGDGVCLGIVDVPGHERFVKNMVAGVSGIDMCIMVIAADDGIMPQTVEHFEIMDLLGVREGIVALTKIDRVAPEQVACRTDEIRAFFKGTFLENAAVCPVSSETLEGYDTFYETLVTKAATLKRKARTGVFRMPVERVFSQAGYGMVTSGIPVTGSVAVGDKVEVIPGGATGRIRGIQCFMRDAQQGGAGQCLALNIPDLNPQPERGQVLCAPGYLKPARFLHTQLHAVSRMERPLKNAEEIKLHTGTLEANGKVYLLETPTLDSGGTTWATIALDEPAAVAPGDRLIVRRPSPARTVAGGILASLTFGSNRPRKADLLKHLVDLAGAMEGMAPDSEGGRLRLMEWALGIREQPVASEQELMHENLLTPAAVQDILRRMTDEGKFLALEGHHYVSAERYRQLYAPIRDHVLKSSASGTVFFLSMADLPGAANMALPLWHRIASDLAGEGLATVNGNRLELAKSADNLPEDDRLMLARVRELYDRTGFMSPRPDEVPGILGSDPGKVARAMQLLYQRQELVRLNPSVTLGRRHLRLAQNMAINTIRQKGSVDAAAFKQILGTSRKYAIAILEFFDQQRLTVRSGDLRRLALGYEKHLTPSEKESRPTSG